MRTGERPWRRWSLVLLAAAAVALLVAALVIHADNGTQPTQATTRPIVHRFVRPVALPHLHPRRSEPGTRPHPRRHRHAWVVLHLPARLPTRSVRLLILTYHRIDRILPGLPAITQTLTVSPGAFAAQMAWLADHRDHTVTQLQVWNALMHGRPLPAHPVLVTFDDAYRDVVTYAAPVLRRHGQHATAYVITDRLSHGRATPWMTWRQLRLLQRDGFDIGSHTVSHADLVAVGPVEARLQLRGSRLALQRFLGHPVQWLAYPYGSVDPAVEQIAQQAGYVLAVTTLGGITQSAADPLLLHRYEVTDRTGVAGLAGLLADD